MTNTEKGKLCLQLWEVTPSLGPRSCAPMTPHRVRPLPPGSTACRLLRAPNVAALAQASSPRAPRCDPGAKNQRKGHSCCKFVVVSLAGDATALSNTIGQEAARQAAFVWAEWGNALI